MPVPTSRMSRDLSVRYSGGDNSGPRNPPLRPALPYRQPLHPGAIMRREAVHAEKDEQGREEGGGKEREEGEEGERKRGSGGSQGGGKSKERTGKQR